MTIPSGWNKEISSLSALLEKADLNLKAACNITDFDGWAISIHSEVENAKIGLQKLDAIMADSGEKTDVFTPYCHELYAIYRLQALLALCHSSFCLRNEAACIEYLSCAVEIILNANLKPGKSIINEEIKFIDKLNILSPDLKKQILLYLNIAMFLLTEPPNRVKKNDFLENHRTQKEPFKAPVFIVAGGASLMDKTQAGTFHDILRGMMSGFSGTIISGGTVAGIPGLVGEVKAEFQTKAPVAFKLIAYLPKYLPGDAKKSVAYDWFYETDSDKFSVFEILSYWCDIVSGGIQPADVILAGFEGGIISALEYRIALSLGAKVGVFAHSGRAASAILNDNFWKDHRNLLVLPNEIISLFHFRSQIKKSSKSK